MCIRDRFMEELRTQLLQRGFEIYTCICPLNPHDKIEHIFVPELRLGFVTANPFLPLEKALAPYRVIHFTRFTDMEALKKKKQRMRFNQRMAAELLDAVSYTHLDHRVDGEHDRRRSPQPRPGHQQLMFKGRPKGRENKENRRRTSHKGQKQGNEKRGHNNLGNLRREGQETNNEK